MLVAHAFREMAKASDIAIQNGGGVLTDIAKGDLTMGDAYKLLPFANTLVGMDMTGTEIKSVLEEALDYALQPDGSTGAYPYAAGLRWHVTLQNQQASVSVKWSTKDEMTVLGAHWTVQRLTSW